jgi:protein-S-isoprenylcysteine O-methyltransferase Ste14
MKRAALVAAVVLVTSLAAAVPAAAHDQPESRQSNWVMADWMLEVFFLFAAVAFLGFLVAWKAGHFHNLEQAARIPLGIHEEDYYTPDWALDEEEWDDVNAQR